MFLLLDCPDVDLIKTSIRALDDVPCVSFPSNARDSQHQIIGWQIPVANFGLQHCAVPSWWLNERISLSRYSRVPLGNFEQDWVIHTANSFFARALRDQQQILWVSDNGILDLGGDNEEETCYSNEFHLEIYMLMQCCNIYTDGSAAQGQSFMIQLFTLTRSF